MRPTAVQACPQFAWITSALLGFGAASGCVLGLETPAAGPKLERPEPQAETPPPRPQACAAECRWSPGYWHWDGGGYVWIAGHWERESASVVRSAP